MGCDPVRPPLPPLLPAGSTRIYPDRSGLIRLVRHMRRLSASQSVPEKWLRRREVPSGGRATAEPALAKDGSSELPRLLRSALA
jgi:hypothetical protein